MNRLAYGATLALIVTAVLAPSASADVGGGTPIAGAASAAAPAAPAPAVAPQVSTTRSVSLTRRQTRSVQRRVNVRPDGKIGAKTRSAIRRYQARRDLKTTGRPNLETLRTMRLAFADAIERRMSKSTSAHASVPDATPAALAGALAATQSAIGSPYRSGGTTTAGFDCSGLMVWAFQKAGVKLPRTSFEQYRLGTAVAQEEIQVGDLVFFSSAGPGASHVGIATSPTTVISATSSGVKQHQVDDGYWGSRYVGARRIATA
ncbi:MAG: C40 family peptidase [Patulibacter sp.]|nr:C40 family peptidase [Patulibacter sp.]